MFEKWEELEEAIKELSESIKENGLEDNFKLLGIIQNPFPYVKKADLYVLSVSEYRCGQSGLYQEIFV